MRRLADSAVWVIRVAIVAALALGLLSGCKSDSDKAGETTCSEYSAMSHSQHVALIRRWKSYLTHTQVLANVRYYDEACTPPHSEPGDEIKDIQG